MDTTLIAFVVLFALLIFGVPIGYAMGLVGTVAFAGVVGWQGALNQVGNLVADTALNYNLSVLPLFVLMGSLFARAGMADELYAAAYGFLGARRGGLAMATILACGAFSAISGSALACAATMTKVSVPVMRKYGYAPGFAAATVAVGSTLDILIPPSIAMVVYALISEVSLGKIMVAGILPGLLAVFLLIVTIVLITNVRPDLGPAGEHTPWIERLRLLRDVWPIVALFSVVLGGIYLGVFSANEAAGVGAFGSMALAIQRRTLSLAGFIEALVDAARVSSMLFVVLFGSLILANFVTVSGTTAAFSAWINSFHLGQFQLIMLLLLVYIVLGFILEGTAVMLLTVPILLPVVVAAGIDPIWFGIFVIIVSGAGLIHPPLGLLLFVVKSLLPDVEMKKVVWGVVPYLGTELVLVAILIAFPGIVMYLPSLMK